jgi:hypothetical protein
MGFPQQDAVTALLNTDGDVEAAVSALVAQPEACVDLVE